MHHHSNPFSTDTEPDTDVFASMMPVTYEARQFMHDGSYTSMTDGDPSAGMPDPYGSDSVPDLSSFNVSVSAASQSLLSAEDHRLLEREEHERNLMAAEEAITIAASMAEHAHLDLSTAPIPGLSSSLHAMPALAEHTELHLTDLKSPEAHADSPEVDVDVNVHGASVDLGAAMDTTTVNVTSDVVNTVPMVEEDAVLNSTSLPAQDTTVSSQSQTQSPSQPKARTRPITKPEREIHKQSDGKYHCTFADCSDAHRAFNRRCEWNKHMDKHERPYRCDQSGCEKLPGFTYSGGLLRHQREVHGKHGGPKKTVNCPHLSCKRHTGKGFSRQENLNEHLRRVHTSDTSGIASPPDEVHSLSDESEKGLGELPALRKRAAPSDGYPDEVQELREQIKRLHQENQELRAQFQQEQLTMMAQITELQGALRLNNANLSSPRTSLL
ncbi:hypothetical protein TD95_003863 [Thielaviopsis punctulata]|uniref:C2H2-type domain-containing protein n=1 Tax=Thielaviopsis punctulata TaxID=72032 RepID=A0A0F4ZFM3_9PEZI|nr:hypothetical protein TD95_003863 [Thielaviopsis punctulata]